MQQPKQQQELTAVQDGTQTPNIVICPTKEQEAMRRNREICWLLKPIVDELIGKEVLLAKYKYYPSEIIGMIIAEIQQRKRIEKELRKRLSIIEQRGQLSLFE